MSGVDVAKMLAMWVIGGVLIFLAIKKDMEPSLLLPMGFGAILCNLPNSGAIGADGPLTTLYNAGISNELFPLLLFIGIGAMIDFEPMLANPKLMLFGAADGPTAIVVANTLKSSQVGSITVAAYSYMALVPIIQPPIIRALTTKHERLTRMPYKPQSVSKLTKILFPIFVTIVAGLVAPASVALIGFLMFGNLLRECGVLGSLSETAQNVLANLITLVLGLVVASQMQYAKFLQWSTLIILALGLFAFVFDTAGGVLFAKLYNVFAKEKINPMIGAAGISAFPMSSRVIHKMALKEDPQNFILMQAVAVNVSGQIASVIAGGLILGYFG